MEFGRLFSGMDGGKIGTVIPQPSRQDGWERRSGGSGYDDMEVSVIEGALYSQGIWKSVDQSMMNAGGEFSVPARVAIYKKIHKVAYGENWLYSFDNFVTWDRSALPKLAASPSPMPMLKTNRNHNTNRLFKMEESITPNGRKIITVIMN